MTKSPVEYWFIKTEDTNIYTECEWLNNTKWNWSLIKSKINFGEILNLHMVEEKLEEVFHQNYNVNLDKFCIWKCFSWSLTMPNKWATNAFALTCLQDNIMRLFHPLNSLVACRNMWLILLSKIWLILKLNMYQIILKLWGFQIFALFFFLGSYWSPL